ncbi:MAG: cupin domain-containing protein [Candidatus Methylomirabilales bacterium]
MEIVNRNRSRPFITKDGSEIRSILDRTTASVRRQSLAEATLPAGARTQPHRHRRTEELYYVLRGRGAMRVGAETRAVGPGDGILIPPGAPHAIRNTGRAPLVFLCCCAPPYSHEDTVLLPEGKDRPPQGRRGARAPGAEARRGGLAHD